MHKEFENLNDLLGLSITLEEQVLQIHGEQSAVILSNPNMTSVSTSSENSNYRLIYTPISSTFGNICSHVATTYWTFGVSSIYVVCVCDVWGLKALQSTLQQ